VPPGDGAQRPALANYGVRLGGWLIDWVLLLIVSIPVLIVTHSVHRYTAVVLSNGDVSRQRGFHVGIGGISLQAVIVIAYGSILCGSIRGQTVGMMLVGSRCIDEQRGGPIGFPRALGRAAFEYLLAIVFLIPWIIDMLFPIWDPKSQTLHDKVTRTVVVKT
jgi:uncharacterized RDD family membrane protein YckC